MDDEQRILFEAISTISTFLDNKVGSDVDATTYAEVVNFIDNVNLNSDTFINL